MSGGHFDYDQYKINSIAIAVEDAIANNDANEHPYPYNVIKEFKTGLKHLNLAAIYAQRIDWLISGDDGNEAFIRRLDDDLKKQGVTK